MLEAWLLLKAKISCPTEYNKNRANSGYVFGGYFNRFATATEFREGRASILISTIEHRIQ